MNLTVATILAVCALLTSILSAILGMGGGIMLLAVMFSCSMPHGDAIPTHAAVQIASNGTRVLAFLKNVDRSAFLRFLIGVFPGAGMPACDPSVHRGSHLAQLQFLTDTK